MFSLTLIVFENDFFLLIFACAGFDCSAEPEKMSSESPQVKEDQSCSVWVNCAQNFTGDVQTLVPDWARPVPGAL